MYYNNFETHKGLCNAYVKFICNIQFLKYLSI